ncbi:NAD-dependent epimerase/dehydratase family protein [Streptomyces sp. NPDC098077]|uniref:NAD-dependent epimerase/dehydratase family protein n=1 Tax=Streptomyces sp. NPDC098077 TaxID=3366093 RepID=UPI0038307BE6
MTGAHGYLGSVLTRELVENGAEVIGIDNGLFSSEVEPAPGVTHIDGDIRDVAAWASVLKGVDTVIHLAAIVGDPACAVSDDLAWETNYLGTVRLTEASRKYGVRRFVFASTCSNYGVSTSQESANVRSPLHPQSVYAATKIYAEHHVLSCSEEGFSTVILRMATLYGLSPRMRFDLGVNIMTAKAVLEGRITVHGGSQWRPFLHVQDASAAFTLLALLEDTGPVSRVWNCGSAGENYRLNEVARIIAEEVPGAAIEVDPLAGDPRDYRVDFHDIQRYLSFVPRHALREGVRGMAESLRDGLFDDFLNAKYNNHQLTLRALHDREVAWGGSAPASGPAWPQLTF